MDSCFSLGVKSSYLKKKIEFVNTYFLFLLFINKNILPSCFFLKIEKLQCTPKNLRVGETQKSNLNEKSTIIDVSYPILECIIY